MENVLTILDLPRDAFQEIVKTLTDHSRFLGSEILLVFALVNKYFHSLSFALPYPTLDFTLRGPLWHDWSQFMNKMRREPYYDSTTLNERAKERFDLFLEGCAFLKKINRATVERLAFTAIPIECLPVLREYFPNVVGLKISNLDAPTIVKAPRPSSWLVAQVPLFGDRFEAEETATKSALNADFSIFERLHTILLDNLAMNSFNFGDHQIRLPTKSLERIYFGGSALDLPAEFQDDPLFKDVISCSKLTTLRAPFFIPINSFPELSFFDVMLCVPSDVESIEAFEGTKLNHLRLNANWRSDSRFRFPNLSRFSKTLRSLEIHALTDILKECVALLNLRSLVLNEVTDTDILSFFNPSLEILQIQSSYSRSLDLDPLSSFSNLRTLHLIGDYDWESLESCAEVLGRLTSFSVDPTKKASAHSKLGLPKILSALSKDHLASLAIASPELILPNMQRISAFTNLTSLTLHTSRIMVDRSWLNRLKPLSALRNLVLSQRNESPSEYSFDDLLASLSGKPDLARIALHSFCPGPERSHLRVELVAMYPWLESVNIQGSTYNPRKAVLLPGHS